MNRGHLASPVKISLASTGSYGKYQVAIAGSVEEERLTTDWRKGIWHSKVHGSCLAFDGSNSSFN